jgi:hypothetical protein
MPTCEDLEQTSAKSITQLHIDNCRCNLQSLQNLTALLTLEREHTKEEKMELRMMGWHLGNLTTSFAHIHG